MKSPRLFIASLLFVCSLILSLQSVTASAQQSPADPQAPVGGSGCTGAFLTFPAWYQGLVTTESGECEIISPSNLQGGLSAFVWTIVLNIVEIILNLVGYASVGFIIYGGYKYMISAGSPDGMVSARKTILNAVIGLILSIVAVAIVRIIPEVV